MNSKLRFLGDGMADACVKCYFSRLRSTSSALLGLLSPDVERETTHFGSNPPNHGYIIIARSPSSTTYKKAIDLPIEAAQASWPVRMCPRHSSHLRGRGEKVAKLPTVSPE
jgi:hypothetical protein